MHRVFFTIGAKHGGSKTGEASFVVFSCLFFLSRFNSSYWFLLLAIIFLSQILFGFVIYNMYFIALINFNVLHRLFHKEFRTSYCGKIYFRRSIISSGICISKRTSQYNILTINFYLITLSFRFNFPVVIRIPLISIADF